jgi:hypothetical protein
MSSMWQCRRGARGGAGVEALEQIATDEIQGRPAWLASQRSAGDSLSRK